jgi:thiosulfate dehydrogenase [quinone] large subunit
MRPDVLVTDPVDPNEPAPSVTPGSADPNGTASGADVANSGRHLWHSDPSRMSDRSTWASPGEERPGNLPISNWLFRSREASLLWLVARLWLGYEWTNAGYQKIWGSERSAFWFGGGVGVKGFATAGITGSTAGKGGASYGWWAGVLHNFVIPNASALGKVVALGEVLIGVGLIVGLFTGAAAIGGLLLNLMYMFSGSAGVNPMYAIVSVFLILAWRNAGWIGLDRLVLQNTWTAHRRGSVFGRMFHRTRPVVATAP